MHRRETLLWKAIWEPSFLIGISASRVEQATQHLFFAEAAANDRENGVLKARPGTKRPPAPPPSLPPSLLSLSPRINHGCDREKPEKIAREKGRNRERTRREGASERGPAPMEPAAKYSKCQVRRHERFAGIFY